VTKEPKGWQAENVQAAHAATKSTVIRRGFQHCCSFDTTSLRNSNAFSSPDGTYPQSLFRRTHSFSSGELRYSPT
jgi:hypothetical protein